MSIKKEESNENSEKSAKIHVYMVKRPTAYVTRRKVEKEGTYLKS